MNLILSTGFAVVKINAFHCLECILFYLQLYIHFFLPPPIASVINTDCLALIILSPYIPHHHIDI